MPYTSNVAVEELLGRDYDTGLAPSLSPYVHTANALVTQMLSCASRSGYVHTSEQVELIERWLAAHAYACSDPTYLEKETQSARGKYMGTSGKGLDGSRYGQMAMNLDGSGCLTRLNKTARPQLIWLGLHEPEQTTYEDRNE